MKRPVVARNQAHGHLACAASALPMSYDNWTATSPLYVLHRWYKNAPVFTLQREARIPTFRLRKPLSMGSLMMGRMFRLTPNGVLMVHEWLTGVQLRHFRTTCAVHIENCEGWWLSGCCGSVAEHCLHKPGVLGSIPGNCRPFHFALFSHQNSYKTLYFQREARISACRCGHLCQP